MAGSQRPVAPNVLFADGVFEGGGVKGIALVGALSAFESRGFKWRNLAGTSAGAIVASLLASGYSAEELKDIIGRIDYTKFEDASAVGRIPLVGPVISLLTSKALYKGDFFEEWLRGLLREKGISTFRDLKKKDDDGTSFTYKLNVITSDISNQRLVVLPSGLGKYGIEPDEFSVARAVRMSMSIPLFFRPQKVAGSLFVDGGILSNFPIWLFDAAGRPRWPTFGFKLVEPESAEPQPSRRLLEFSRAILDTMKNAHDKMTVEDVDMERTIAIPTLGVKTTQFDLSAEQRDRLYQSGLDTATRFLQTYTFDKYVAGSESRHGELYRRHVERSRHSMRLEAQGDRPSE
ncbi:MAG: patatin-like phospholipase family protein [Spirochaetia bacterium]|jgi:NTE family protein